MVPVDEQQTLMCWLKLGVLNWMGLFEMKCPFVFPMGLKLLIMNHLQRHQQPNPVLKAITGRQRANKIPHKVQYFWLRHTQRQN